MSEDWSVERLSVAEAAEALGVTRDAVHKRIKRRSIKYERGEDGRFYVYVDTSSSGLDKSVDESVDESKVEVLERLIEGQQERIAFLEREMRRRGDETERLHQIVAGLAQANAEQARTIRAIEAPATSDTTQDAETVEEEPEEAEEPGPAPASPQTASEQTASERPQRLTLRGLGRRIFGS